MKVLLSLHYSFLVVMFLSQGIAIAAEKDGGRLAGAWRYHCRAEG